MRRISGDFRISPKLIKYMKYAGRGDLRDFYSSTRDPLFKYQIKNICKTRRKNPLIILGRSGSGKTLLATSVAGEMDKAGMNVCIMTCERVVDNIVNNIRSNESRSELISKLSQNDIIIIDEIEGLKQKESIQLEVARIIFELVSRNVEVILLGLPENDAYGQLIKSLNDYGLKVTDFMIPDMTRLDRCWFIIKKCRMAGLKIPKVGIWKMSKNSNLGTIIGMVNSLYVFSGTKIMGYRKRCTYEDMKRLLGKRFSD